jgi:molybdenum transport protein
MINFNEKEIDYWLNEDIPYFDLTTHILGIGNQPAKIHFISREQTVICGTEEVKRIFDKLGIKTKKYLSSGTEILENITFMEGEGSVESIHAAWKVCINILEYASGIATRTSNFVKKALQNNPDLNIAVTRKVMPGTKKLSTKATLCGGAVPHRLGLSETILIFDEHIKFLGGLKNLPQKLNEIKKHTAEKKIEVEVHNINDAIFVAGLPVDLIQVDKMLADDLKFLVSTVKKINPAVKIAVAGGITIENVEEYSKTGADIIVTSALYSGKTSDIKAKIFG